MGLFDWVNKLKDELGAVADKIIPGDQSSWHSAPPAPTTPTQQQAGAQIGAGFGYGPSNPAQPMSAPMAAPTPAPTPAPVFKLAPPPPIAASGSTAAANIGRGFGYGNSDSTKPYSPPMAAPTPASLDLPKTAPPPLTTRGPVSPADVFTEFVKGVGGTAADLAHGVAQVPVKLALQGADMLDSSAPHEFTAQDPVRQFIFGKDTVTSYQNQADQFKLWQLEHGVDPTVAGLSTIPAAGAMAGLDLFTGGKGKTTLEALTKTSSAKTVAKLLTDHFGESAAKIPDEVIKTIAAEKDPGKIAQILKGSATPPSAVNPEAVVNDLLPGATKGPQTRGFVETVQNSDKAAPELKTGVTGSYDPITNADTFKAADAQINKMGYEQAIEHAKTNDSGDVLNQAMSLRLADNLQQEGRYNDAIEVINKIATRATKNGQDTQILAAYNRLTPEGIVRYAMKGIDDAKKEFPKRYGGLSLDPEKASALRQRATDIQAMPEGIDKMVATHDMLRDIAKLVPSTNAQKAITLWKAGLLTGVKGQLGNQVGNASHVLMRKLSDVPASAVDAAIGAFTGQRGKTFTLKGLISGIGEGTKAATLQLKHGFDPQSIVNNKYDVKGTFFSDSPLGKAAQKYADTIFRMTAAGDRPYYYAALRNSLQDQAKAAAITAKVPLNQRKTFIANLLKSPTEEILVRATADAQDSVFANDNAIGQALKDFKRGIAKIPGVGETIAETNIPFTGVPSSIATAVINYSPVGAIKAVYDAIKTAKSTGFSVDAQRSLSEALGRATTGTGIMWLGYKLFLDDRLTLGYPSDPKERALWQQEGKQPYSVLIGGKWRSLNYTGPMMALIGIGGQVAQNEKGGSDTWSAIGSAAGTAGQSIIGSSPLKGVQGALDVVNDPARNGKSFINGQAGSVVPTLVKDVSNATDDTKREVNGPIDAIKSRIPGVRNGMPAAIDEFGQPMPQDPGGAAAILDPFKSTEATSTPLVDELQRLSDAGQAITPTKQDANLTLGGVNVKLQPDQLNAYKQAVGAAVTQLWSDITTSPGYANLDDAGKNAALAKAKAAATTATNAQFAKEQQLGDPQKALSDVNGVAASVLAGTATPDMFTTDSNMLSQATKVQQMKDAYAADKAAGKLSPVDDFKRQKAITTAEKTVGQDTTAQIASKYTKDAVSLASLGKKDLATLIANGSVSQSLVDEMTRYKNEVAAAHPKAATVKKGRKVAMPKGGSVKVAKVKMAKVKAPKVAKAKAITTKVRKVKVAKVKTAKARLV